MTLRQKILLVCAGAFLLSAGLLVVAGYFLTREFREREAVLQPLLATNAPLDAVKAAIGNIQTYRRGTSEWLELHGSFAATNASAWSHKMARKIESSASTGFTSTMDMMTFIFLDEHDRLIDFALGTQ